MKWRTTILLLLAVLALGAYIMLVDRKSESTREREEQARKALRVDASRVSYLRFESTNLLVECAQEDGTWMIIQPVRTRADAGEIDRILNGLQDLPRGEVVSARDRERRGATLAQYGFEPPTAAIAVGDNLHRRTILVGREALLGGSLYIKDAESDDIVATETNLLALIPKSASDLRDRVLFRGSPDQVQRLGIGSGDGFLQMARVDKRRWVIQQPLTARASPTAVQEILDGLFLLRVERFVTDSGADLVTYGLDEPRLRVNVWSGDKEGDTTLLIGKAVPDAADQVYAKLKSGDAVVTIGTNGIGSIPLKVEDLRDRRLLDMSSYDVAYFRAQDGERAIAMQKRGEKWDVVEPRQWKADDQRVHDLMVAWAGVKILAFVDNEATNLAPLGLETPARTLTFAAKGPSADSVARDASLRGGEDEVVVQVSPAKRAPGVALVKVKPDNSLYEILSDTLKTISMDPLYYRDRQVLDLSSDSIVRISLTKAGREQVVERDASGAFAATGGEAKADPEAIKDLLLKAAHLRVLRFEAEDPQDLKPYGLDAPKAVLTLGLKDEAGISKSLLFGADSVVGEGVYAMLKGQDVVFVLDKTVADKMLQSLYATPAAAEKESVDLSTNSPAAR